MRRGIRCSETRYTARTFSKCARRWLSLVSRTRVRALLATCGRIRPSTPSLTPMARRSPPQEAGQPSASPATSARGVQCPCELPCETSCQCAGHDIPTRQLHLRFPHPVLTGKSLYTACPRYMIPYDFSPDEYSRPISDTSALFTLPCLNCDARRIVTILSRPFVFEEVYLRHLYTS